MALKQWDCLSPCCLYMIEAGDLAIEYLLLHVSQVNEVCKKAEKSKKSAVEMISDIMPGLDWALELIDY